MRIFLALVIFAQMAYGVNGPSFAGFPEFQARNIEIVWAAPTNNRPAALWVYKVIPQTYSANMMSNLMALGHFTLEDRVSKPSEVMMRFQNKEGNRYLNIVPANGWVRYWDNLATSTYKRKIEGVPSQSETEEKALALLGNLGISRSDFATKPGSSKPLAFGELGHEQRFDKSKNENVTSVYNRGIFFIRQIEGVSFAGIGVAGGCHVNFGLNATVARLELIWRNLQRYEHRKVASPEEIARFIKEGKAVMTHRNVVNPNAIKKLTITEAAPLYMGASGMERQDFVYPFAQFEAVADLGNTNMPLQLYCPIITDETGK